jgi:formylglycine-generating enzyme required for sulfatase activity
MQKLLHWIPIPASGDEIRVDAITAREFADFIRTTGYVPTADTIHGHGHALRYIRLNFGGGDDVPFYGATIDDAEQYCMWTGTSLPDESELRFLFESLASTETSLKWHGLTWTKTTHGGLFVAMEGPYRSRDGLQFGSEKRMLLERNHFAPLESPCVRIVRRLGGSAYPDR